MKNYKTDQIRNIALIGNAGAGKTTLAEAMLFEGGILNRRGEVTNKNTASDYTAIEQDYGNSIYSSVLYTEFNDKKINVIDTPGMKAFAGAVTSSLNVVEAAVCVLNSADGIGAGTEGAMRIAHSLKTPVIFLANGLDHEHVNFDQLIENVISKYGHSTTIIQYPVNAGIGFNQIIDVLKMKMYQYGPDGGDPQILDIPASEKDKAEELHNALIEKAAENDEGLMETFFDKGSLEEEEMRQGIRLGMRSCTFFPVLCASAKKNMGVKRFMEFVINNVSSPAIVEPRAEESGKVVKCDAAGSPSLFVFKTSIESHIGEVTYFKVMSGVITEGLDLMNTTKQGKERLSQLFAVAGKNRAKVTELCAGDLGATVKLKETKVNHTLSTKEADYKFASIIFPKSLTITAVKAANESDDEKVGEVLHRLRDEDPSYVVYHSKELKQLIVEAQSEYHLNVIKWFFDNEYKIEVNFITPKIPYRETITKAAQSDYRHKKQSGGAGQFGEVHMIIEPYVEGMPEPKSYKIDGKDWLVTLRGKEEIPLSWGGKLVFCNCIVGGSIDARFHPAILKGIMEKMEEGPLTGSYARDIRVCIYDGKMHPVDSNEISFKLAGRNAFSMAFKKAGPKILEPIYNLEVYTPSERMGDVMSDLQGRRALIMGMGSEKGYEKISAKVPLKEMNKYSTSLSSLTGGRGWFNLEYDAYEKVPADVQDELLKAYEAEQDDE
ncbi:MAG TPA: elongation factor G [Prolixibacteraceae bacterium]|nr:elongation factor G [Prolixibacteraceae bacterium]HPS12501.1 elongation factor G [Prolixibacteraceae bacterium]